MLYSCRNSLEGFNGRDLLTLHRSEMAQLVGHEEAARLEGQLTIHKKMIGVSTITLLEGQCGVPPETNLLVQLYIQCLEM